MWPDEVVEAAARAVYASKRGPVEEWICDVLDAAFGVRDEAGVPVVLKPWLKPVGTQINDTIYTTDEIESYMGRGFATPPDAQIVPVFRVVSPEEPTAG